MLNNKLWVIGGYDGENKNDVWSSIDGVSWIQITSNAEFSKRQQHQVAVFDNKLWVVGGREGLSGDIKNDIWSSINGITWNRVTDNAGILARTGHEVMTFDNKLWIIRAGGGVWSSSNGITWKVETRHGSFSNLGGGVVLNNEIWLTGRGKGALKKGGLI